MPERVKINGKDVAVYIDGYLIACAQNVEITVNTTTTETTSKCSQDNNKVLWQEIMPVMNSMEFTGDGLIPTLSSAGYDVYSFQQLSLAQFQQKKVYITWGIPAQQGLYFGINGYITTSGSAAPFDNVATFNFTVQSTGIPNTYPFS